MTDYLLRVARRSAGSRRVPAKRRARAAEELHGHLQDSAREYQALGLPRRKAERRAARDLGDPGRVRTDFARAWRSRSVVLLPRSVGQHAKRLLVHEGRKLLLILLVVFVLRWQVVAAYHIPTKSMEPTLHGDPESGDKILVNKLYYHFHAPQRWQVAVFERDGDDRNLIKRIVGLPGDRLFIENGDVYVGGQIARKPRHVQDALLIPIFADGADQLAHLHGEEHRGLEAWTPLGNWTAEDDGYRAAGGEDGKASLSYSAVIQDEYPEGTSRPNGRIVGDLVLRFAVRPEAGVEVVGAVLREDGDCHEARVRPGPNGSVVLLRNKSEVARVDGAVLPFDRLTRIRFANLDDRISLEIDGREVLAADVVKPDRDGVQDGPVAELGHQGAGAHYRNIELLRDIYYRQQSRDPYEVPDGDVFMLGDNSGNSTDSRSFGPVPVANLIGRPLVVFWPPERLQVIR